MPNQNAGGGIPSSTNEMLNTQRASGMPEIGTSGSKLPITTTNIEVYSNGQRVGFVQSLAPSESRQISRVQELGHEGVVQLVPHNTLGGQLSISRFAVYNSNLFNALGATRTGKFSLVGEFNDTVTIGSQHGSGATSYSNPFKTLKDQRVPLEIQAKTKLPDNSYLIETYLDCWLASYTKTVAANTITITEQATVQYSDVASNKIVNA